MKKNRDLFEFFKFMIDFRHKHRIIRKKLPDAVCGMDALHAHNTNAEDVTIPRDARTFAISFIGYDREKGRDDMVYVALNTYWIDVTITLPVLSHGGAWYLSVNTYGDGQGRYFYPEGEEIRIDNEFIMKPRSVAVFSVKPF